MFNNKNPLKRYMAVLETQRIKGNLFKFKIEAIDETKVNIINILFNIISNSHLKTVCFKYFKYFKDEKGP